MDTLGNSWKNLERNKQGRRKRGGRGGPRPPQIISGGPDSFLLHIGLTITFVTFYLYVIVNHCNYRTLIFIYPLKTADWQSKARTNKSLKPESVYLSYIIEFLF